MVIPDNEMTFQVPSRLRDTFDIETTFARLSSYVKKTPLIRLPFLDTFANGIVFGKMENLQHGGAFKYRGALNAILSGDQQQPLVTYSSGNHGIAVALIAQHLGVDAKIIIPIDAPKVKIQAIHDSGASMLFYRREYDDRVAMANDVALREGRRLIPSFDDIDVIAGQSSVAMEIFEQLTCLVDSEPDVILAPCGGGGLVLGTCLAASHFQPKTRVLAVEPQGHDCVSRHILSIPPYDSFTAVSTLCDALTAPTPSRFFDICAKGAKLGAISVPDNVVCQAVARLHQETGHRVEPSGAIGVGAILNKLVDAKGGIVVAILSGGNIDEESFNICKFSIEANG